MTTVSINHMLSKHHLQLLQVSLYKATLCLVMLSVCVAVCSVVA